MAKKILINATDEEVVRVARVVDEKLCNLDIEHTEIFSKKATKASICKGVVTRVETSLDAAFVDYGAERHGFLPLKEIAQECYANPALFEQGNRPNIREVLKPGQSLIVQIDKEERGNKGAALTTYIGLPGSSLVLMPNNPKSGGISRRIEGEEREELKEALSQLSVPDGMSLIIRTAGVGRSIDELKWDLEVLINQWSAILQAAQERPAPFMIHRERDAVIRALRDHLRPDVTEVLIDTKEAYERAKKHVKEVRRDYVDRIHYYSDSIPLFSRYQIEHQIESAFKREVILDNGGAITIDPTEALTSIDINSAKATEGKDIEETALQTNLVAVKEIARQLQLRDIGGLIVIDLIDMNSHRHQRMVENHLREELKSDRARIQLGKISRFGLLEMSRQRLRPSLSDANHIPCPHCEAQGTIRSIPSLALAIIRAIEEEAIKENTQQVNVQAPVDLAAYLLNEKRHVLAAIEQRHHIQVLVIPNPSMITPKYTITHLGEETLAEQPKKASFELITHDTKENPVLSRTISPHQQPALSHCSPSPSPDRNLLQRLWSAVFGGEPKTSAPLNKQQNITSSPRQSEKRYNRRSHTRTQKERPHRKPSSQAQHPQYERKNAPKRDGRLPQRDRNRRREADPTDPQREKRLRPTAEPKKSITTQAPPSFRAPSPPVVEPKQQENLTTEIAREKAPLATHEVKTMGNPQELQALRKAHDAKTFLKLSPAEIAASIVNLEEEQKNAPKTASNLKQIITKKTPTEERPVHPKTQEASRVSLRENEKEED